eukprot:CAMPEP_0170573214 /NCGR_PEP_ID=MMETSP0224-20130122/2645_1 /TAXON_ID=285029 /ORGANISM="Togula jolla, Strain CCCM 725" /LENGTH=42 /DNA_ID= /DNA_START= /DNA_END= /DNA_ORIENTATION=
MMSAGSQDSHAGEAIGMRCGKNFGLTCDGRPPNGWGDFGHDE